MTIRRRKDREVPAAQLQFDVYRIGDFLRPADRVFLPGKGRVHFLGTAEIKLVGFHAHAVGVGAELAGVDAEENVLGLGVFAADVMHVAGGHGGHAHLPGQIDRRRQGDPLRLHAVVLDFDVISLAENLLEPGDNLPGFFQVRLVAREDQPIDLAGNAAAQADQAFVVGFEEFLVDARPKIKPFQKRRRGKFYEILKSCAILGQKREMITGLFRSRRFFLKPGARGDVGLQSQDGIDGKFLGLLIEFHRPVKVSVIGKGQGVHAQGLCALQEIADLSGPVQQAVMAVTMQMHKRRRRAHGSLHVQNNIKRLVFYHADLQSRRD